MSDEGGDERLIGKRMVAAMLGVTVRQVERYVIDADDPLPIAQRAPRGSRRGHSFDIRSVYEWSIGRMISGDDEILDLGQERARLAKVQADRQELLLGHERGELVEIEEVGRQVGGDYLRMRSRLRSLGKKLAPALVGMNKPAEIEKRITREVDEALTELSSYDPEGSE